jgi:putative ABC transport system permease protein
VLRKFIPFGTTLTGAVCIVAILVALPLWAVAIAVAMLAVWLAASRAGRQAWSVAWIGISTLPQRRGLALVVVGGTAAVVTVFVALLAMAQGFEATLRQTGNDYTAIMLRSGSQAEINSTIDRATAVLVAEEPQVMRNARGRSLASAELVVVASLPTRSGDSANVEIRGIGPLAWRVHPEIHVVAGRRFAPGLRELVVGSGAAREFRNLSLGARLELAGQPWRVVGEFESGDAHDSELWADSEVVAAAYRRQGAVNSVTVKLQGPGAFEPFKTAVGRDPRLRLDVYTTRDYYNMQSAFIPHVIRTLGATVALIMAIGAAVGALNTMYASVATRTREIATLRALGFGGGPVVASVLLETMLLALLGGCIGAVAAWAIFGRLTASTLGANFSEVVFEFRVTPTLIATGLKWALAIGLVGGLFPAMRAARLPITRGLRAP